ncbi:MBL fold metallo-hydrolase [Owenweeksia hongkongensis]|uniref:MBL fold metallo-hydrolase n=1 Tax=Owenweeksia hongkongensis TaxID=253245 RepID=UPI003A944CEE
MQIKQLYTGCLAEAAYYIESNGEVAIIDPIRDTEAYIQMANETGATIKYIFETHFHADFVSGHVDLAKTTGATIVYGSEAKPSFDFHGAQDGEVFILGNIKIKALHTPGHTLESTTYLLLDEEGKEHAIFTGDTLFIGDVGRPDLAVKSDLSQTDLAGLLYDSLRNKIMTLPDEVIVYPAHGAGSACGKNMSKERFDTLGNQKKFNYALRENMSREEFIVELTTGLSAPPQYFPKNVTLNQRGYDSLAEVIARGTKALSVEDFLSKMQEPNTLVLDTRKPGDFAEAHIPGALFIGIDGGFAPWVGTVIEDIKTNILIVCDEGREEEVVTRLARVGYDYACGYLDGGMEAWLKAKNQTSRVSEVEPDDLATNYAHWVDKTVDVRKPGEYADSHILDVPSKPLDFIHENKSEYSADKKYYLHCAGGYRSMIAASVLKQNGVDDVVNVKGGFSALKNTGLPLVNGEMAEV